jgi:hypothetical protein
MAEYVEINHDLTVEFMRHPTDDGTELEYINIERMFGDPDGSEINTVSLDLDEARSVAEAILKLLAENTRSE